MVRGQGRGQAGARAAERPYNKSVLRITLDTNTARLERVGPAIRKIRDAVDVATTTTVAREIGSVYDPSLHQLRIASELWVMGESPLGVAVLGGEGDPTFFERVLAAITNESFPKPGSRSSLSQGQRNQLRDAMIFYTHVREARDIFVTNDVKAFGSEGTEQRRRVGALAPTTRVMTLAEFERFCDAQQT